MSKKNKLRVGSSFSDGEILRKQDKDLSPYCKQRDKISPNSLMIKELPWTEKQKPIIETLLEKKNKCVILDGPPGSAKTILAVYAALKLLNSQKVTDIIYIRSLIQAKDGETGFLVGDLESKTLFYNIPLQDKLEELLLKKDITSLHKDNRIKTFPTSMLRGYNFNVNAILIDEAQNMLFSSLITAITRAGEFSKVFITGDSCGQNDLGSKSGFKQLISLFNDQDSKDNGIQYIKLDIADIKRSEFVKFIMRKLQAQNLQY